MPPIVLDGTAGITTPDLTDTSLTATRVVYAGTSGNLTGSTNLIFDGSNLGVGSVPTTWGSSKAIQIGAAGAFSGQTGAKTAELTSNAYLNSGWKYLTSGDKATLYYQYDGAHTFNATTATGTAGNAITWDSGTVINPYGVGIGGATPSSGTGITFPATQSASSNANTLDDYEEGTWTPAGFSAGYTASTASGTYTKIGRMVYCRFRVVFSAVNASSNSECAFSGYPFTAASTGIGSGRDNSVTGAFYVPRIDGATTSGGINSYSNIANNSASVFVTGRDYDFTLVYQT